MTTTNTTWTPRTAREREAEMKSATGSTVTVSAEQMEAERKAGRLSYTAASGETLENVVRQWYDEPCIDDNVESLCTRIRAWLAQQPTPPLTVAEHVAALSSMKGNMLMERAEMLDFAVIDAHRDYRLLFVAPEAP